MTGATTAHRVDDEAKSALHDGLTISQISKVYGITPTEASLRVGTIKPNGTRHNVPIYHLRDLAPLMWSPTPDEIDTAMRRLSHHQLPKTLTKEYWAGMRSRQEYRIRAGELWPTTRVIERVGELVKLIKMNLQLMNDTVERQTELTERQRQIIKGVIDGTLREMRKQMVENFTIKTEADIAEEDDL